MKTIFFLLFLTGGASAFSDSAGLLPAPGFAVAMFYFLLNGWIINKIAEDDNPINAEFSR
jgi:hypothetical protein